MVAGGLLLLVLVEVVYVDGAALAGLGGGGGWWLSVLACWWWWSVPMAGRLGVGRRWKTALWPSSFSESRSRRWRRVALAAVLQSVVVLSSRRCVVRRRCRRLGALGAFKDLIVISPGSLGFSLHFAWVRL